MLLTTEALAALDGIEPDDWPTEWTLRGWTPESLEVARQERLAGPPDPEPEPDIAALANVLAQLPRARR